jgi:hypothetical protein
MMETSVLLQSQELKRTKRLFLRDKERLEVQLAQSLEEVDGRDRIIMERDQDNGVRVMALQSVEEELKGQIGSLRAKISDQQAMLEGVKAKLAKGGGGVSRSSGGERLSNDSSRSERVSYNISSVVSSSSRGERRGTTMGLSDSSRKDARSVGVTVDELTNGASEAYKDAVDKLRR